jgi:hypothetical protein
MTPKEEQELLRRIARIDGSLRVLAMIASAGAVMAITTYVDQRYGSMWGGWITGIAASAGVLYLGYLGYARE